MKEGLNRRKFIKTTAAAGAGLMFAPNILTNTAKGKGDDLNVAILGVGAQGEVLMNSVLNRIPNIRFKAVCDIWDYNRIRISRYLKKCGHENNAYIDFEEMLANEKDLDAVIVATPDFWHSPHTVACLRAGLNVYCEKEMSNTLEGARKMVEAQKETGKLLQIGHQRRSNPRYIHCLDKLLGEANILGQITTVNGQWNRGAKDDLSAPPKLEIPKETLKKYGFKSMHQFRNWRWFKGLGGGPIVDLGSHQIDVYNWFLGTNPAAVSASGGTDFYDKETHEWYDGVMAIYEYKTKQGTVRAFYQTLTTNSNQGYFESFMGNEGTLIISEASSRGAAYPENIQAAANEKDGKKKGEKSWMKWVNARYINEPDKQACPSPNKKSEADFDVRESPTPPAYEITASLGEKKYHEPHLKNFFDSIRGKAELNCPVEIGYESAVSVLKVNEAVEAGRKLEFKPEEFIA